ncbi:hypothetical protein EJ02DRAFT_392951 [Clathrospora elynae]|uniref:Wings apart-like protein C-terminal domain-containing protein n=1 Tax=Clathrospora elynae TaxID=706981 RepID=A0A6A5T399_9PLEO|nr:hypothetical protein EJ02DRAFT_392951 [Clathrospora elynae]
MATMLANFTSADRRKKVVTYSKSSRLSTVPSPAPVQNDDAPSPERPRKHAAASNGSLKKAGETLKAGNRPGNARAKADKVDIFEVPSEDEFLSRLIKPAKKLPAKRPTPKQDFEVPTSEDKAPKKVAKPSKATEPLCKPENARPAATVTKKQQKPVQAPPPSSSDPIAPRTLRGKAPQPAEVARKAVQNGGSVQRPTVKAKASSRATTPAPPIAKAQKNVRPVQELPSRKAPAKPQPKPSEDLDMFDVPSSDEEAPLIARKPSRQIPAGKTKEPLEKTNPTKSDSRKGAADSDDSNASKKRKRQGSVSSISTVKAVVGPKREPSATPQRSRKYQKKQDSVSPVHESQNQSTARPARDTQPTVPAINKPRRTRLRTVPVLAPPKIAKGQSSPATLSSMLPSRQAPKPSPVAEVPEVAEREDETMYEIPEPLTTPVHASKATIPCSTTPRQKVLFSGLLGESSSSTTSMPSISTLRLTDRNPRSLVGALSRSKSDVSYSAQARKTRLIDTLKPVESSSEDEDEDNTSESGQELGERMISNHPALKPSQEPRHRRPVAEISSHDMDVNVQAAADSQTSQATSGFGIRSKLTYAMSRSYLQEANPEDDLLISMDLGDDAQKKDSISEDEQESTSQAQAYHELKSRGRNYVFQQEAQTMIDDISSTTNNSIRRNTMMELGTKMADETYSSQLLDSTLAPQFFRHIASGGEIIFDFATAVATIFILQTNPTYTVLDQLHAIGMVNTLVKLAGNDADVRRISKDRKTNMSKIAQESMGSFRTLAQQSSFWSNRKPEKLTPQLVALKALELLIVGLRTAGNTEPLLDQTMILQLVELASKPSERLKSNQGALEDALVLDMVLSILESVSATRQKQSMWSTGVLQHIAEFMPIFFRPNATASTMLAVKLCMNLTNNKPKACQQFSDKAFIQPLMLSIIEKFRLLDADLAQEERTGVLESLILSLGAMINLAEFSDKTRLNVDDDEQMVATLVKIFLERSERASQADSMEESHSGVAVGYLTVLLGNLCLNASVRSKIRALLPKKRLDLLINKIKEFVRVHEHVDSTTDQFEGAEGQETYQNYTARLLLVVEKLEKAPT